MEDADKIVNQRMKRDASYTLDPSLGHSLELGDKFVSELPRVVAEIISTISKREWWEALSAMRMEGNEQICNSNQFNGWIFHSGNQHFVIIAKVSAFPAAAYKICPNRTPSYIAPWKYTLAV